MPIRHIEEKAFHHSDGSVYRVSFSVVGNRILLTQPSGFSQPDDTRRAIEIADGIIDAHFDPARKYVQIEDYSRLNGASLEARAYFIGHMKDRPRLLGLVFCNLSPILGISVNLARLLQIVDYEIEISKTLEDALEVAAQMLAKESAWSAIPNKPKATGSPEKTGAICPLSGLPIICNSQWENIRLGKSYQVTFRFIGKRILLTIPRGNPGKTGMQKLFAARRRVLDEMLPDTEPFCEIKDYGYLTGLPSRESRDQIIKGLRQDEHRLIAFLGFNASHIVKMITRVGAKLYNPEFELGIVEDYQTAVLRSLWLLENRNLTDENQVPALLSHPEWEMTAGQSSSRFEIIDGNILHGSPSGPITIDHVGALPALFENVFASITTPEHYYLVIRLKDLSAPEWRSRKAYIDFLLDWHRRHPFDMYIGYGANRFVRAAFQMASFVLPFKLAMTPDLESALTLIRKTEATLNAENTAKQQPIAPGTGRSNEIQPYVDELLQYIGNISWEDNTPFSDDAQVSPDHPFRPVFDALSLIKNDHLVMLKEKRVAEDLRDKAFGEMERQLEAGTRKLIETNLKLADEIDERKKTEIAYKQAKIEAEAASQAKSEFLANMSHEIRTPMNAILGFAELLQRTELSTKQADYVHKVRASALNLLGIINDILDFSKIEAGKLAIEHIAFHLDETLDNLIALFAPEIAKKGLELIVPVTNDIPNALVGDPLRLHQILLNLISNAFKFTDTGEIVIRIELVEKGFDRVTLKFSVRDSGIGIAEDKQTRLFQSFSQGDGSTTRKYGGTGLGLAICKQLVAMMNGEIWVESREGHGSTFCFTAQFGRQHGTAANRIHLPADTRGARILVVDDNDVSRKFICRILKSL